MARLGIVADRVEETAKAGAAQGEQQHGRERGPEEEVDRHEVENLAGTEPLYEDRHMRLARQHLLAVDDHHAARHQACAECHDEGLHAQQRNPDPVDQADDQAESQRDGERRGVARRSVGGEQIGRACRDARDREVDAAGQHHQRLSGSHDGKRRREQQHVGNPQRRHGAGAREFDAADEKGQHGR